MSYPIPPVEPYRIKSIEPIRLLSRNDRIHRIEKANYNLFKLDSADVYIDLMTDSGFSAMSAAQWGGLMKGDESYAGASSFRRFEETIRSITGLTHVAPCHQGRAAEHIVFRTLVQPGQYIINNTHFDTTRANTLYRGAIPVDLPCREAALDEAIPFKGNMDVERLEEFLHREKQGSVGMVIMTVTNNSVGGQPVSMENLCAVSALCKRFSVPFFIDSARFAENCHFIRRDETGYSQESVGSIARQMFSLCDGMMMSAKKDAFANIGGFIAVSNADWYRQITELMVVLEGFPTYGGLAGRDLDAIAIGLQEVLQEDWLTFRIDQVAYLGECLKQAGMPIVEPTGGHAVFIDAGKFLPHLSASAFPGQALSVELYIEGGVRSVEIGSLMMGETDAKTGAFKPAPKELVRLAMPRRVYTNTHFEYIGRVAEAITARKKNINGYKITRQAELLRHFTCDLAPLTSSTVSSHA